MPILRNSLVILITTLTLAGTYSVSAENATSSRSPHALEQMVRQDCGSCHGLTFKGGLGSPLLPESLAAYSVEDLTTIILDGLPGTAMPPWRAIVTPDEATWMARYLKTGEPE